MKNLDYDYDDRIDDDFDDNEERDYEEKVLEEYEKDYGKVEVEEDDCYDGDDSDEDREPLSGDDIENQDDWEVWKRYINNN